MRSSRLRQLDAETLAAAVEDELPKGAAGAEFTLGGSKKKKKGGGGRVRRGGGRTAGLQVASWRRNSLPRLA
jgi:hypothetical protein